MDVRDLTRDQLIELKQSYLIELDDEGTLEEVTGLDAVYWGSLANADEIVPDEVIFEHYGCYSFVNDDFFCSGVTA